MSTVAQTYPQFAVQLAAADWSSDDLRLVRSAFDLGASLFVGAERGSAKPFIDHLVGTASATLIGGGDPHAVAAALLHAAYEQGDFGDGRLGATPRHRARLLGAAGPSVEGLVRRYSDLAWNPASIRSTLDRADILDPQDRTVLLIRVANEIDDVLDGQLLLSGKMTSAVHTPAVHELVVALAAAVGNDRLVALARLVLQGEPTDFPPELIIGNVTSVRRLPARAMVRPGLSVRAAVGRVRRAVEFRLRCDLGR